MAKTVAEHMEIGLFNIGTEIFVPKISRPYKNFQQQKCGNTREMTGIKQLVLIQHVRLPITALQMLNLDVATSLKMFGRVQPMFAIRSDSEDILVHTALHKPQQIL